MAPPGESQSALDLVGVTVLVFFTFARGISLASCKEFVGYYRTMTDRC